MQTAVHCDLDVWQFFIAFCEWSQLNSNYTKYLAQALPIFYILEKFHRKFLNLVAPPTGGTMKRFLCCKTHNCLTDGVRGLDVLYNTLNVLYFRRQVTRITNLHWKFCKMYKIVAEFGPKTSYMVTVEIVIKSTHIMSIRVTISCRYALYHLGTMLLVSSIT